VVAGLSGCSSKKAETESTKAATPSVSASASVSSGGVNAATGTGTAKVTIDGQPQDVQGTVACTTAAGNFSIAVGNPGTGIGIVMAEDGSKVNSVGLGSVNGVSLGYTEGAPGGNASATKDGKTYTITGTATGVDMANPMQPLTKPFEISVTCP
jgi:lipoprotein LpqH